MVKHTQIIRRQFANEYGVYGVAALWVKQLINQCIITLDEADQDQGSGEFTHTRTLSKYKEINLLLSSLEIIRGKVNKFVCLNLPNLQMVFGNLTLKLTFQ